MTPTTTFSKSHAQHEVPAIIRTVTRESVQWDKPVFRPPPLKVQVPVPEFSEFAAGLRVRETVR